MNRINKFLKTSRNEKSKNKKKIHQAIDLIEDKDFLKFVWTLLNKKLENFELSKGEKKELNTLKKNHKSETSTGVEVKKRASKKSSK